MPTAGDPCEIAEAASTKAATPATRASTISIPGHPSYARGRGAAARSCPSQAACGAQRSGSPGVARW